MASSVFNRRGSHSGRGFRYQDAVGAWLAVSAWGETLPFGEIVPEGLDDFELRGRDRLAFVQAKSRRDGLGPFSAGEATQFIAELWRRHDAAPTTPDSLLLILERPIADWVLTELNEGPGLGLPLEIVARTALRDHADHAALATKTRVLVLDAPMEETVTALAEGLACPPFLAQVYQGELVRQIGELSDDNGVAKVFQGLAVSDTIRTIEGLREQLSVEDLDAALVQGLCETIDFLTPLLDPLFHLGVDVQPGHLAAGLIAERPQSRQQVIAALESQRVALVAGPSGSGKSAVMWEAARASRHVIRWYRVARLRAEDIPALLRFARSLRASRRAPVGLIFDDVGRGQAAGWNALLTQAQAWDGLVMLGSIREEDVLLLEDRSAIAEIRAPAGEELAARIWRELRAQGLTQAAGWREAWEQAHGLLLEYTYLLSHGGRMAKLLGDQIARRLREDRFEELDILRVVALAGSASISVETDRLAEVLALPAGPLAKALRRLIDEHLVREEGGGRLGGLHQLRSVELVRLSHETPPPTLAQTLSRVVALAPGPDLDPLLARVLADHPHVEAAAMTALVTRLEGDPDPAALAAALDGLGQAHIVRTIREWLPIAEEHGIVPTQISATVMFALAKGAFEGLERLQPAIDAGKRLQIQAAADLRHDLIRRLPDSTLATLIGQANPAELEAVLAALAGAAAPAALVNALDARDIDLLAVEFYLAVRLCATAQLLTPNAVARWVALAGQDVLLARLERETPWAAPITLRVEDGQTIVAGDIRHIAAQAQGNPHDAVVAHCQAMLALAPGADLAVSDAVAVDGAVSGLAEFPLATKRIPRENLPPEALPRWNRRWMKVAAQEVATETYSLFLERARHGLEALVPKLELCFDRLLRGQYKNSDALLDEIGEVHEASRRLTPPREMGFGAGVSAGQTHTTPLQAMLFTASADLLRYFAGLPGDEAVFLLKAKDLAEHVEEARREPWEIIGGAPSDLLDRLATLTDTLRLLGGEAVARQGRPHELWRKTAKAAQPRNALRRVAFGVRRVVDERLNKVKQTITAAVQAAGILAQTHVRLDLTRVQPWPTCEVLVLIELDALADWETTLDTAWPHLRAATEEGRNLWIAPIFDGVAIGRLTVGGVRQPFPAAYEADGWLKGLGATLLEDPCSRLWVEMLDALVMIDGAVRFGYGAADRPAVEQTILAQAQMQLDDGLVRLKIQLDDKVPGSFDEITAFVAAVRAGTIDLAGRTTALTRGQDPEMLQLLTTIHRLTLACDLIKQSSTQGAHEPSP